MIDNPGAPPPPHTHTDTHDNDGGRQPDDTDRLEIRRPRREGGQGGREGHTQTHTCIHTDTTPKTTNFLLASNSCCESQDTPVLSLPAPVLTSRPAAPCPCSLSPAEHLLDGAQPEQSLPLPFHLAPLLGGHAVGGQLHSCTPLISLPVCVCPLPVDTHTHTPSMQITSC